MKLSHIENGFLYENILLTEINSVKLWEHAGRTLAEAELTADQIKDLFQQVEKGASAAGSNRTLIGKGKDAATAVAAAYQDLKNKVINSGPMQDADKYYDQAAEKLKQATGGDQGVVKYVQKYRDFAKKHPVAQSFIYAALIAAAGISGTGAGGAAALGLLKMTDKLLQGEKFSKAAVAGAETGAMAYAAGQIGKTFQGSEHGQWKDATYGGPRGIEMPTNAYDYVTNSDGTMNRVFNPNKLVDILQQAGYSDANAQNAQQLWQQYSPEIISRIGTSESLSDQQVSKLFESVLLELGIADKIKGGLSSAASAIAKKAQSIGHELTTKTTTGKLQKAWKNAGSPTDSEELKKFLTGQGIDPQIVDSAFKSINVLTGPTAKDPQDTTAEPAALNKTIEYIKQWYQSADPQQRQAIRKEFKLIDQQIPATESVYYSKFLGRPI